MSAEAAESGDVTAPPTAQLSYASIAAHATLRGLEGGGWQVKQASPSLNREETAALLKGVCTGMQLVRELPRFPEEEEIVQRPMRLAYRGADGLGLYWHSCPAGPDSTGRPGNVFTHALLDRRPSRMRSTQSRPIELWRSPGWLRPYGPAAVEAAHFDDLAAPEPDGSITKLPLLSHLAAGGPERLDSLGIFLDALAAALSGAGPPVVLAAQTPDVAATWIGLVSLFCAPSVCGRLSFSTFERLDVLGSGDIGCLVSAIPREDLDHFRRVDDLPYVLIDPEVEPEAVLEDGPERWRTGYGQHVPVTDWSRLALDACGAGMDVVSQCLDDQDHVANAVSWPSGGSPYWPLAVAVARREHLQLSWHTAAHVVLRETPNSLAVPDDIGGTLADPVAMYAGDRPQELWQLIAGQGVGRGEGQASASEPLGHPVLIGHAYAAYVLRTLADEEWLLRRPPADIEGLVDIDSWSEGSARFWGAVAASLNRLLDEASSSHPALLASLRLQAVDFVGRVAEQVGSSTDEVVQLSERLSEEVAPVLLGELGPAVVARVPAVSVGTLRRYVSPQLDQQLEGGEPGFRLPQEVCRWLIPAFDVDAIATAQFDRRSQIEQEVLVGACRLGLSAGRQAQAAAAAVLVRSDEWLPDGSAEERVRQALIHTVPAGPTFSETASLLGQPEMVATAGLTSFAARTLVNEQPSRMSAWVAQQVRGRERLETGWLPSGDLGDLSDIAVFHAAAGPEWYLYNRGLHPASAAYVLAVLSRWHSVPAAARESVGPHVLLAGMQAVLALVGYSRECQPLKHEVHRLGPRLQRYDREAFLDVMAFGMEGATVMLQKACIAYPARRNEIVTRAARHMRSEADFQVGSDPWSAVFSIPLDDDGQWNVAAEVLRPVLASFDRRQLHQQGKREAERLLLEGKVRDAFLDWWAAVAAGPDRGSGVRIMRNLFKGRSRPGSPQEGGQG